MHISIQKYVDWCKSNKLWPNDAKSIFAYDVYKKAFNPARAVK